MFLRFRIFDIFHQNKRHFSGCYENKCFGSKLHFSSTRSKTSCSLSKIPVCYCDALFPAGFHFPWKLYFVSNQWEIITKNKFLCRISWIAVSITFFKESTFGVLPFRVSTACSCQIKHTSRSGFDVRLGFSDRWWSRGNGCALNSCGCLNDLE